MLLVFFVLDLIFFCLCIVFLLDLFFFGFFCNFLGVDGRVFVDCMGGKRGIDVKEFDFRFFRCLVLFFGKVIIGVGFV